MFNPCLGTLPLLVLLAQPLGAQEQAEQQDAEPFPRLIYVQVFMGGNWPVGVMNEAFDPSFLAGGRVEVSMNRRPLVRAGAGASFHSFDSESPGTADNEGIINLSVFGKVLTSWGPYEPFGILGVGVAVSKNEDGSRRADPGLQIGGGVELPISEHFSVTTGTEFHLIVRGGEADNRLWLDAYLGFVFRQP